MKKLIILFIGLLLTSCELDSPIDTPISDSGVKKVTLKVETNIDGMTTEQVNITKRNKIDNEIGSIKHLYVMSAYSGEVILYSTVDGKVTSGGKRLTPTVELQRGDRGEFNGDFVMPKIQDDGTYGTSMNYLYWFDIRGVYHQHYVSGGQIVHISDQPLPVKSITINLSELK